jgi:hypothetical protein
VNQPSASFSSRPAPHFYSAVNSVAPKAADALEVAFQQAALAASVPQAAADEEDDDEAEDAAQANVGDVEANADDAEDVST